MPTLCVALVMATFLIGCDEKQDTTTTGGTRGADTDTTGPGAPGGPGGVPGPGGSDDTDTGSAGGVYPPFGETSGGSGGSDAPTSTSLNADGSSYLLLAPSGSSSDSSVCFLVVYSGTEGANTMMSNMKQVASHFGLGDCLVAVLDGTSSDADDGAAVLDDVRSSYDVDNDSTWLLSESAGTRAGLELGFSLRQSYFAAYWANDVNAADVPALDAAALGFAPWGNAGPGGDLPDANTIVDGMRDASYQLPSDAPYSGSGSDTHGSSDQFLAAVSFFAGKRRD